MKLEEFLKDLSLKITYVFNGRWHTAFIKDCQTKPYATDEWKGVWKPAAGWGITETAAREMLVEDLRGHMLLIPAQDRWVGVPGSVE